MRLFYERNVGKGIFYLILDFGITFVVLKWMSKYRVSEFGRFLVNIMLTVMLITTLVYLQLAFTGEPVGVIGAWGYVVVGGLSLLFWGNFSVFEMIGGKKEPNPNIPRKTKSRVNKQV
ncbi:hypothetical protein ACLM5H_10880 [Fredinandcohnia humi]